MPGGNGGVAFFSKPGGKGGIFVTSVRHCFRSVSPIAFQRWEFRKNEVRSSCVISARRSNDLITNSRCAVDIALKRSRLASILARSRRGK